jgi:hypothetical protein
MTKVRLMNQDTILKRAKNVTFEVIAGEAILIDMSTGTYFSLDEVGTVFWQMLDGARTLADLADHIAGTYNEKAERYVAELRKLRQTAVAEGTPIPAKAIDKLAMDFSLEEDDVQEHLQRLGEGNQAEIGPQLVAEFSVGSEMVLNDLYDLATTMQADNLLVTVK